MWPSEQHGLNAAVRSDGVKSRFAKSCHCPGTAHLEYRCSDRQAGSDVSPEQLGSAQGMASQHGDGDEFGRAADAGISEHQYGQSSRRPLPRANSESTTMHKHFLITRAGYPDASCGLAVVSAGSPRGPQRVHDCIHAVAIVARASRLSCRPSQAGQCRPRQPIGSACRWVRDAARAGCGLTAPCSDGSLPSQSPETHAGAAVLGRSPAVGPGTGAPPPACQRLLIASMGTCGKASQDTGSPAGDGPH